MECTLDNEQRSCFQMLFSMSKILAKQGIDDEPYLEYIIELARTPFVSNSLARGGICDHMVASRESSAEVNLCVLSWLLQIRDCCPTQYDAVGKGKWCS